MENSFEICSKEKQKNGIGVWRGEWEGFFFFKNYILADRNDPVGLQVNAWGISLLMASVFTVKGETRSSVESKRKRDTGIWRGVEKHFLFFKCWKFSRLWWLFFINLLRLCGGPLVSVGIWDCSYERLYVTLIIWQFRHEKVKEDSSMVCGC